MSNKGYQSSQQSFAKGGAVIGTTSKFLKVPDQFTDGRLPPKDTGSADDPRQDYEKGAGKGSKGAPKAADKSEKAVLPRK